jgi:cytosine/adenosine deaminase-related metal-dependent hydrolase
VTTELLKLTAVAAKEWDVRLHTHLAETKDEDDFCQSVLKMRPLDYMDSVGWLEGGRSWFAHCVWLNEAESKRMAETKTGVAHCPVSNLRLGSGIAPIRTYLNDGVPVGLAVDGSASNDSSDMLGEARMAMMVARVKGDVGSMPARDVYRLASRGGAAVLGRTDIGSIEPGKAADIAVFDLNKLDYAGGMSDPAAALLFCGASHRAKYVFVNGKMVVKNEKLVNVNERALTREHNKAAKALYRRAGV